MPENKSDSPSVFETGAAPTEPIVKEWVITEAKKAIEKHNTELSKGEVPIFQQGEMSMIREAWEVLAPEERQLMKEKFPHIVETMEVEK